MDELVKAAKSLSDPQRVRVLNLLMQRECCVCQVMEALGISEVNASRYCHALLDAGFLKMHKEGDVQRLVLCAPGAEHTPSEHIAHCQRWPEQQRSGRGGK